MFQSYYKGANLVEELAFSRYFHSNWANILEHVYGIFSTFAILNLILIIHFGYISSIIVQSIMFVTYWQMVPECAIVYPIVISFFTYLIGTLNYSTPTLLFWAVLNQTALGNASHYYLEGFFPAFRFFEVIVSTPVLIALYLLSFLGIKRDLYNEVVAKTSMWKGSEKQRDITKTINNIKRWLKLSTQ